MRTLITVDGMDGAGKDTFIAELNKLLIENGVKVINTNTFKDHELGASTVAAIAAANSSGPSLIGRILRCRGGLYGKLISYPDDVVVISNRGVVSTMAEQCILDGFTDELPSVKEQERFYRVTANCNLIDVLITCSSEATRERLQARGKLDSREAKYAVEERSAAYSNAWVMLRDELPISTLVEVDSDLGKFSTEHADIKRIVKQVLFLNSKEK